MACGAPEVEAGPLMSHDGRGHCFFVRQPISAEEVDAAILGLWSSCCGAVRYGGQDREILTRLAENGEADACDFRLESEPERVHRSHLTFEFVNDEAKDGGPLTAQQIMECFAAFLTKRHGADSRLLNFRYSEIAASFRYEWGHGLLPIPCSVTLTLERNAEKSWLLRIRREDRPNSSFAISIHKAIEHDGRFRQVRWLTEKEWKIGTREGRERPY